jgi:hypothetical protein
MSGLTYKQSSLLLLRLDVRVNHLLYYLPDLLLVGQPAGLFFRNWIPALTTAGSGFHFSSGPSNNCPVLLLFVGSHCNGHLRQGYFE